nr:flagellar basal body P-ring formation chaperone FlgA [uncultured Tolumonas sp.]
METEGEVFIPPLTYLLFLLLLLFPTAPLLAKAALTDTTQLATQLREQLLPLAQNLQKQPGWQTMLVSYDPWLPDSAEHLTACQSRLKFYAADHNQVLWGRHNYRVECPDQTGWMLRARVTVSVRLPVWVAARNISRQKTLSDADLQLQTTQLELLTHGFSVQGESLVNYRAVRPIAVGQVLDKNNLRPPLLVRKGEQVVIRAGQDGFAASMSGIALQDGVLGQMINVRNSSSQKEIQAEVSQRAEVSVHF